MHVLACACIPAAGCFVINHGIRGFIVVIPRTCRTMRMRNARSLWILISERPAFRDSFEQGSWYDCKGIYKIHWHDAETLGQP